MPEAGRLQAAVFVQRCQSSCDPQKYICRMLRSSCVGFMEFCWNWLSYGLSCTQVKQGTWLCSVARARSSEQMWSVPSPKVAVTGALV